MAYGTFKSVAEVAKRFGIKVKKREAFIHQKKLVVSDILLSMIKEELHDDLNYVSESAICEGIIRPILKTIAKNHPLEVWSHVPYNVDEKKGLVGIPDYLIALLTEYGDMERPALCIVEAKDDKFNKGWTQALAEMVASSLLGAKICYGIVSTGVLWQFGKLENNVFVTDPNFISATNNLQQLFNTINWMFNEVSEKD